MSLNSQPQRVVPTASNLNPTATNPTGPNTGNQMQNPSMPSTGPPKLTTNVKHDDYIILPALKDCTKITVGWTQDRTYKEILCETIPRTAEYYRGYGFNLSASKTPELLVYIAVELYDDGYAGRAPGHLAGLGANGTNSDKDEKKGTGKTRAGAPIANIKGPWVKITEDWQYGVLHDKTTGADRVSERFIVYHPKTRKPYSKRFETAQIIPSGGALLNMFKDTDVSPVSSGGGGDGWNAKGFVGSMMGSIICQCLTQGVFVPLIDQKSGNPLENFDPKETAEA